MAWLYSLSAELGADRDTANAFQKHFDGIALNLESGTAPQASLSQDDEGNWWCMVLVRGLSERGVTSATDAYTMTETGLSLYERLRNSPIYRFALTGVEVDIFRQYTELIDDEMIKTTPQRFPGLVLNLSVWDEMGKPPGFKPFTQGYVWVPYTGEVYAPLTSDPALKSRYEKLLA